MNNDRELLELAAKAADIPMKPDFAEKYDYYMADPLMWNPLTDDGDALRLAVKLNRTDIGALIMNYTSGEEYREDPYAATRRAIVRAAAEIGKAMP